MAAVCLSRPIFRIGTKAPLLSPEATGLSQRFPQKSDGLEDLLIGKSEKLCIASPVQMEVNIPKPEAPPERGDRLREPSETTYYDASMKTYPLE